MQESEFQDFQRSWLKATAFFDKDMDSEALRVMFGILRRFQLDEVRQALLSHVSHPERGRFYPKPADIIAAIAASTPESDRWPTPNEAWAQCPKSEHDSAMLTAEHVQAYAVCDGLDAIAGRVAFIEAYTRIVEAAKARLEKPKWFLSQGADPIGREQAITDGVRRGLLTQDQAALLLPHRQQESAHKQLTHEDKPKPLPSSRSAAEAGLTNIRAILPKMRIQEQP